MRQVPGKGIAALGALALNDVRLPHASIILGESHVPFFLCILRTPVGLAWLLYTSSTLVLVTMTPEPGPAGAGV